MYSSVRDCTAGGDSEHLCRYAPEQIKGLKGGCTQQNAVAPNQHLVIKCLKQNARALAELDPL
ncbi:MAG: hypothetical protein KA759_05805, partial [Zoogloea sp.]|nr:hypothetical protein [Zoogloea sp.]